jgi:hypothetical protein
MSRLPTWVSTKKEGIRLYYSQITGDDGARPVNQKSEIAERAIEHGLTPSQLNFQIHMRNNFWPRTKNRPVAIVQWLGFELDNIRKL